LASAERISRRRFLELAGSAVVGLAVGAAAGYAAAPPKEKIVYKPPPPKAIPTEPLRFGIVTFLTGIPSIAGVAGLRAAEIWIEKVNAQGGILGRKIEYYVEDETGTVESRVEKFKKLTIDKKCDVIFGTESTSTGLAYGPLAEELQQLWLSWDGTTQKGLEETLPKPTYAFRSIYNEAEAVAGAIMVAKYFPEVRTVAGINDDYSYGRNCWEAFMTVLKHYIPDVEPVIDLWPKLGETDFTSHIAAIKAAKPDLVFSSFWHGGAATFLKQAAAVGLFKETKGCLCTAGGVLPALKKEFVPEGIIIGCNSFYFKWTDTWPMLTEFVNEYIKRYGEYPVYEADHAWFTLQAYKAAVEKAYAVKGEWPEKEEIAEALRGIIVPSLSGFRGYREDNYMICDFFQGITKHDPNYDFVLLDPVERISYSQMCHPPDVTFHEWVKSWKAPGEE